MCLLIGKFGDLTFDDRLRLAHSVLEAFRRDNGDREVPLQAFLRRPARVRRGPRWLTADRRGARAQRF